MDRAEGFWWSPDGRKIAFARVDAGTVPPYVVTRADGSSERHRYPFAGGTNARVTLGVVDISPLVDAANDAARGGSSGASRRGGGIFGGIFGRDIRKGGVDRFFSRENPLDFDVVWLDVDCGPGNARGDEEEYLVRVAWSADSERVFAQVQRRDQRSASLIRVDARTGERCDPAPLVIEYPPAGCGWVNLAPPSATFRELRGEIADPSGVIRAGDFLWGSWRTGHLHLYVHCGSTGVCKRAVSAGDWSVDELIGVDELSGHVYFTGTADGAAREAPVPRAALGTLRGRRLFDLSVDGASHPARRLEPVLHGRGVYEVRVRAQRGGQDPDGDRARDKGDGDDDDGRIWR